MRQVLAALVLMALACSVHAQQAPALSSQTDYSLDAARALPLRCKADDIALADGRTMGDLFGSDWPAQPPATVSHVSAHRTQAAQGVWPRGLETVGATAVVAVLVDASGKPLRAEPICVTRNGFDKAAARMAMRSVYSPAQVDGAPITSVVAAVFHFRPGRSAGRAGSADD